MADNKRKQGKRDDSRVAAGQPYELYYFARKWGITADQARRVLAKSNNRDAANKAAQRLSGR